MTRYLVRLLNGRGEHHATVERDHDAIDAAGALEHPYEIQVWEGERMVARYPPKRPFT